MLYEESEEKQQFTKGIALTTENSVASIPSENIRQSLTDTE